MHELQQREEEEPSKTCLTIITERTGLSSIEASIEDMKPRKLNTESYDENTKMPFPGLSSRSMLLINSSGF